MIRIEDKTQAQFNLNIGTLVKHIDGEVAMIIRNYPMYVRVLVFKPNGYERHSDFITFWKLKEITFFNGEVILENEQ